MATAFEPYIVYGTATDKNGNILSNTSITLTNNNSGETITTTTNGSGQYVFDCANFSSGYYDGDKLTLSLTTTPTFQIYASHNGANSWYQISNGVTYIFEINSGRIQIDETNNPGGRQLNIVKG